VEELAQERIRESRFLYKLPLVGKGNYTKLSVQNTNDMTPGGVTFAQLMLLKYCMCEVDDGGEMAKLYGARVLVRIAVSSIVRRPLFSLLHVLWLKAAYV
jgi:hypothetical protein